MSGVSNRPSSTSDSATRLTRVAEFGRDQFGGVGVDHVGDLVHLPLAHQQLDDVHAAFRHAVGEFLDGDRLGQDDFARQALLLLHHALEALGAAAEGGDRTRALLAVAGGGAGDGQAAALLHLAAARRLDRGNGQFRRIGVRRRRGAAAPARRRARPRSPEAAAARRPSRAGAAGRGVLKTICCGLRRGPPAGGERQAVIGLGRPGRRRRRGAGGGALRPRPGAWPRPRAPGGSPLPSCGPRRRRVRRVRGPRARRGRGRRPPGACGPPPRARGIRSARGRGRRARRRSGCAEPRRSAGRGAAGLTAVGRARRRRGAAGRARRGAARGGLGRGGRRRGGRARRPFGGSWARRFTFSTTTALVRPCEKLWRTDALLDRALQRQRLARRARSRSCRRNCWNRSYRSCVPRAVAPGPFDSAPSALKSCSESLVRCQIRASFESRSASSSPRYNASRRAEARKTFAAGPCRSAA